MELSAGRIHYKPSNGGFDGQLEGLGRSRLSEARSAGICFAPTGRSRRLVLEAL